MIPRRLTEELDAWKQRENRKPLVLRGARQVGKTTLVHSFSRKFEQYIYLNLELGEDRRLFETDLTFEDRVASIFLEKNVPQRDGTLLFIDEIQNSANAVAMLRYFYEKFPGLYVIAAGSMLEILFEKDISFPVGRVEYLVLRPFSFVEFLTALGEGVALSQLDQFPPPPHAHQKLIRLFNKYTLLGGMPEAIQAYSRNRNIADANHIYENLILAYLDDVEKYGKNDSQVRVLRHCLETGFREAGSRIKFEGFGKGPYRSREVGDALRTLEKAMLLHLVYPTTGCTIPIVEGRSRSPRLQFFDTGMVNFFSGLQNEVLTAPDISSVFKGRIAEHIVGQEILAASSSPMNRLLFWVRNKKQSQAEVDYVTSFQGKVVPVEVKSGSVGRLRSLHLFMDQAPHQYALRLYGGEMAIDQIKTIEGKPFVLLNLPYYQAGNLAQSLRWFSQKIANTG